MVYGFNLKSKTPDVGGPATLVFEPAGSNPTSRNRNPNSPATNRNPNDPTTNRDPNDPARNTNRNTGNPNNPNNPNTNPDNNPDNDWDNNRNNNPDNAPAQATPTGWSPAKGGFTASNVQTDVANGFSVGQTYYFNCP